MKNKLFIFICLAFLSFEAVKTYQMDLVYRQKPLITQEPIKVYPHIYPASFRVLVNGKDTTVNKDRWIEEINNL